MNQSDTATGSRHTVLVLDDDSAVRDSLKFSLEIEGFEVRTYASPMDLLNDTALLAASCLIVDYHMPTMNGLDVVESLRNRRRSMPAILVTSHPNSGIRERAAAAGVILVEKPFRGAFLMDCIRTALDPGNSG
jgi:two-component system response regulator FixJ